MKKNIKVCACGSNKRYMDCCGMYHQKKLPAPTPEALMRSRYTAFVENNLDYIRKTMKGIHFKNFKEKNAKSSVYWKGLEIMRSFMHSSDPNIGYVEFIAYYREHNSEQRIHELSEFHLINGRWYYVNGQWVEEEEKKSKLDLHLVTVESSPNADILRKPSKMVEFPISTELTSLIEAMKHKLIEIDGAGLAAPQVGYPYRIIVFHVTPLDLEIRNDVDELVPMTVLINPSFTPVVEEGKVADWEGCFSVESIRGKPSRYRVIHYEGYTPEGEKVKSIAKGHLARLLQHEIDHIRGTLFTDILTPHCVQGSVEEMMAIRHQELEARAKKGSSALATLKAIEEKRRKK